MENKCTSAERRSLFASLVREHLSKMTPSVGEKFSGQQIAYAKGRAWKAMQEMGL
jgi:hypothetical protein